MFKYSWDCLYYACKQDCNVVLNILKYYNGKKVNTEVAEIITKISKCPKPAYIHDLYSLLNDATASANDKCMYLYLASKRNIVDYQLYGTDWLNINLASVDASKLKHNRLIELINDNIYFKY